MAGASECERQRESSFPTRQLAQCSNQPDFFSALEHRARAGLATDSLGGFSSRLQRSSSTLYAVIARRVFWNADSTRNRVLTFR